MDPVCHYRQSLYSGAYRPTGIPRCDTGGPCEAIFSAFIYREKDVITTASTPHEVEVIWAKCKRCNWWILLEYDDFCGTHQYHYLKRIPVQSLEDFPLRVQKLIQQEKERK